MIGIYKITNQINGKSYIGQSVDIQRRWKEEKTRAFIETNSEYKSSLSQAFRKYGVENFTFEVVCECNISELNELEKYYIQKFNTFKTNLGYNCTPGGDGGHVDKITNNDILQQITFDLQNTKLSQSEIGAKYGVTNKTISDINCGRTWFRTDIDYPIRKNNIYRCVDCGKIITKGACRCIECSKKNQQTVERPEPIQLAQEILNTSFLAVGKKYGVTDNAIRRWCTAYGMPTKKDELKKWLSNQDK